MLKKTARPVLSVRSDSAVAWAPFILLSDAAVLIRQSSAADQLIRAAAVSTTLGPTPFRGGRMKLSTWKPNSIPSLLPPQAPLQGRGSFRYQGLTGARNGNGKRRTD